MKKNLLGFAAFALILTSCQENEIIEHIDDGNNQLEFGVYQGKATKAAELTNDALHQNGIEFPLYAYKEAQSDLKEVYFADTLIYSNASWNTSIPRFLFGKTPLQFYAFYPTTGINTKDYKYPSLAADLYPTLDYTIQNSGVTTDLVAATVNNHTGNKVTIPFRHILSQINFGVKGYYGAKIKISNIEIQSVNSKGTFSFDPDPAKWGWGNTPTTPANYPYRFGSGATPALSSYTTPGGIKDNQTGKWSDRPEKEGDNTYVFGDGGKWGPGSDKATGALNIWYVGENNIPTQGDKITAISNTDTLSNSLMLMPQALVEGVGLAYATFDYTIQDLKDAYIVGGPTSTDVENGQFDLNMGATPDPLYANVWKPNMRYLYIIDFKGYLDGKKLTFEVDVDTQPWENYNKPGDGIVLLSSLDGTVFDTGIKGLANDGSANGTYDIPAGHLFSDITWDWSSYNMDNSFTTGQSFKVTFTKVKFNGNELTIVPPFGFEVTAPIANKPGVVNAIDQELTFTPQTNAYYGKVAELNTAIGATTVYCTFNVSNKIKLTDVITTGFTARGNTITLNFAVSYSNGVLPPNWAYTANDHKTVKYTAPAIP